MMPSHYYERVLVRLKMADTLADGIRIVERLIKEAQDEENGMFDLMFMKDVYGITHKTIRVGYHVKLYHEEYKGCFDWYLTTGTLVPHPDNGNSPKKIAKTKDAEEVAKLITNYVLSCTK